MNKALYFILPVILVLAIYGVSTSNELTGYFTPYKIKNSNSDIIFSMDKSSYQIGQTINFTGKVVHPNQGGTVLIKITDSGKNTVDKFNALLNSYGIFVDTFKIPATYANGKYVIDAKYVNDAKSKPVSMNMTISTVTGVTYILIPYGASSQSNKLNFAPNPVNVHQGAIIVFKNNDVSFHSIFSGKVNDDGSLSTANLFNSSYISPGNKMMLSLKPGTYDYFCKIHPWLGGTITVEKSVATPKASPVIAKTVPAPSSNKFPISNATLLAIWNGSKDLKKLYPEAGHGNYTGVIKWAKTLGWDQDKRLSALIPAGKVPSYLKDTLVSIWKERKDLQKLYPEVARSNMVNMTKWATTSGYSQYDSLSALAPQAAPTKSTTVSNDVLLSIWKERIDLQKLYPEAGHGNFTNMLKWGKTSGYSQYDSLSTLAPPPKATK